MTEEFILTSRIQHSKKCKDGRRRNYYLYYLNGILIFKQKAPFDENWDYGYQYQTRRSNCYILNCNLYQTRTNDTSSAWWRGPGYDKKTKVRDVRYPISKKTLEQFNIPIDFKIQHQ